MDVRKMIEELLLERSQIDEAIMSLERLDNARGPRRGRPPAWMTGCLKVPTKRGRPRGARNKPKKEEAA
jgi:hypothetical protein